MIAMLIYYCPKCDAYFEGDVLPTVGRCPVCESELETKAAINADELKCLIHELLTPQGIVKMMTALKAWLEPNK